MGYSKLPDDYKLVWSGDFKENKKLYKLINYGTLILLIPFLVIYFVFIYKIDTFGKNFLISFLLFIPVIVIHELIHGIFFKMGKNVKIKFGFHGFAASCSAPNSYLKKRHYLMVGMAPAVIINIGLIISLIFVKGDLFEILYLVLAFHFTGCIGDFYICGKLLKQPQDVLIRDYGIGMEFYSR